MDLPPAAVIPSRFWELHFKPRTQDLEFTVKQRHLDNIEQLAKVVNSTFYVNKYSTSGDYLFFPHQHQEGVTNSDEALNVAQEEIRQWRITLDLSRNFLSTLDIDQLVLLLYNRLKGLQNFTRAHVNFADTENVEKDNTFRKEALQFLRDNISTVDLRTPQNFANQIICICLTSNVLQETPRFGTLIFPSLTHYLLNQNHLRDLTSSHDLTQYLPSLTYLDLKHNKLTTLEGLNGFLGSMKTLHFLLLSCNFVEDDPAEAADFLPPFCQELRCLGLFSNLIREKAGNGTVQFDRFLERVNCNYPHLEEFSAGGNPILFTLGHAKTLQKIKEKFLSLQRYDGTQIRKLLQ